MGADNTAPGMSVRDLIDALQGHDPEAPVWAEMSGDSDFSTVQGIRDFKVSGDGVVLDIGQGDLHTPGEGWT